MTNFSASIPVEHAQEANDRLAELGFGPGNFSIPCGGDEITHAGLHCFHVEGFREAVEGLAKDFPDLKITEGNGEPNFVEHVAREPFEQIDPAKLVARKEGDFGSRDGKRFESIEKDNIWPVGTIGWKAKGTDK